MKNQENTTNPPPQFHRVPPNFLKNVKLVPHNFNLPEKAVHGTIVSRQLREDLFDTIYKKVQDLESPKLIEDNDYFKLSDIQKANCVTESLKEKLGDYMSLDDPEDQFLQCEKWTISGVFNGQEKNLEYKVKVVHSVNDHFYTIVHPDTFVKSLRLYTIYQCL